MPMNELLGLSKRELVEVIRAGHPIDPRALEDAEYRGVSLGLPAFVEKLTWKTFKKVFHRDRATGLLRGWNVRMEQHGLGGPFVAKQRRGAPFTFGHFAVVDANRRAPRGCDQGLLLDYGAGHNAWFDPTGLLRDPIVALTAGSAEQLFGRSYVAVGKRWIGTPSFFLLERDGPLSHIASPRVR